MSIEEAIDRIVAARTEPLLRKLEQLEARVAGAAQEPRPWLTVTEAAEAARLQPTTVREWIKRGRLAATGRPYRIRRADLDAALQKGDPAPAEPTAAELEHQVAEVLAFRARSRGR